MGSSFLNVFNIFCSVLVQLLSSFFSMGFVIVHMVHPHSSINIAAAWKPPVLFYWINPTSL